MAKFLLHLCGVICYRICCSVMVEHRVQSVFGTIISIIQFGIDYESVTYFAPLSNMLHRIGHMILDYEKA